MSSAAIALTADISAFGVATFWIVNALLLFVAGMTAIFSSNSERRKAAIRIARLTQRRNAFYAALSGCLQRRRT
jgi:hypothetical protein